DSPPIVPRECARLVNAVHAPIGIELLKRRRDGGVGDVVDAWYRDAWRRDVRGSERVATQGSAEQAGKCETRPELLVHVEQQIHVALGVVLSRVRERAGVVRIGILDVASREIAIDLPVVVVLAAAKCSGEPVVHSVRAAHASDYAIADVVFRVVVLQPVRVVVEVVVPVVQVAVRIVLLRLQLVHIHLTAEPDELFENASVVALARPVVGRPLDVLNVSRCRELAAEPEVSSEGAGQIAERVVRDDPLRLVVSDRKAAVRVVGSARYGEGIGEAVSGLEETIRVVRVRNEWSRYAIALGIDWAVELRDQLAVHARAVALIVTVVHTTALAVLECEIAARTLAVEILPV